MQRKYKIVQREKKPNSTKQSPHQFKRVVQIGGKSSCIGLGT